jgi:Mg/Co/Ni transporter MgtE
MPIKSEKLTHAFLSKHPDTAARVLEKLEPTEVVALFEALPVRIVLPVMRSMSSMIAAQCLRMMDSDRQVGLVSELGVRMAANIIRLWSAQERGELLRMLPRRMSVNIRMLLRYPAESVGSIMNTEYISVYSSQNIGDVEELLRKSKIDHQDEVYVTDDSQRLKGIVSIMRLLREDNSLRVTQVMVKSVPAILATAHVSQVLDHASWESRHTLPVIDRDKRLVGTLQRATLLDKLETRSETSETYGYVALDVVHAYWTGWMSMLTAILVNTSRAGKRVP